MTSEANAIDKVKIIVPGALHTDLMVVGVPHLPGPGEDSFGPELRIGPGGKSRNIADMLGHLTDQGTTAMLSYTSRDPYGLWKPPYDALQSAGVNTDFVTIVDSGESGLLPGIALVSVDIQGNRNASISNTIINNLTPALIDDAEELFAAAARRAGLLALSLEMPFVTAVHAIQVAHTHNLLTVLDPGGLAEGADYQQLLRHGLFLIKPNEHEARQLSGIEVRDLASAERAAQTLHGQGAQNVLITHGAHGAYLYSNDTIEHIPAPELSFGGQTDATGCGDQVLAALCAALSQGKPLSEAARIAVRAGTLQYHRVGVQPVTWEDL